MMKMVFFFQNIVGAHWLNIVGAAAPTAPMVPTPPLSEFCFVFSGQRHTKIGTGSVLTASN